MQQDLFQIALASLTSNPGPIGSWELGITSKLGNLPRACYEFS